ncbi:MAG TPA: TonB-dependent receptor plug domain-containing protein [Opitutus sp.]|nr:TonB-dependent receptor plug domain-containing protein [Opitutus sp.]
MNMFRSRKFVAALSLVAVAGLLGTSSARAQAAADSSSGNTDSTVKLEKYTVTGSNIPTTLTAAEAGTFPLVALDRLTIEKTGYSNAAELLQKLTINNSGSVAISNNATGFTPAATSVSLRGLGPEATLVLINGHRVAPYPVGQSGDTAFVDLNTIPLGMIESIEVLKDGASAVYGADAVAGVVNVKLRKNYNGSEAYVQYKNTTDKDSTEITANLLTGVSNEKGSLTVGFNYQRRNAIMNRDRDYSAVPAFLSSNSSPINAQISVLAYDEAVGAAPGTRPSGIGATRTVFFATPGPLTDDGLPTSSDNNGHVAPANWIYSTGRASVYNYNQDSMSFPSWTRYGMILNGERKILDSDKLTGYIDANYQSSTTHNELAPSATGSFTTPGQTTLVIPARTANPILTVIDGSGAMSQIAAGTPLPDGYTTGPGTLVDVNGLVQRVAVAGAYNPNNPYNQDITDGTRFRMKEFGNRIFHDTNEAIMATLGVRGENIMDAFNFDAGFRYSEIAFRSKDTLVSTSKFNQVVNQNSTLLQTLGLPAYNPFGYYANPIPSNFAVTAAGLVHLHDVDISTIGNGFVTVNTEKLFSLPGGDVGAAIGIDYRVERLQQSPDNVNVAGDTIGSSPAAITDHDRKVGAIFAEMRFPVASPSQSIPGFYDFTIDLAGRYEDFYTTHDTVAVPKIGIGWKPFDDTFLFRASASKGFLEPSLFKLYSGPIAALLTLVDPRTGETLDEEPIISAGNSKLKAENSKAYNIGVVWTPKGFLGGFTTNVDLWRIERDGTALIDHQDVLDRWGASGNAGLLNGEAVILDPAGNIAQVVAAYQNAGQTLADGADFGASYVMNTDTAGRFDFAVGFSYLHSYRQASIPGQPLQELVDQTTDGQGNDAFLKRKARVETTWTYKGFQTVLAGNFIDGFTNYDLNGDEYRTGSSWTFDLRISYSLKEMFGPYLKDTTLVVGSTNILNRKPPLSQYFGANSTNYPGFIYTAEDRLVYVSLDKKF